MNLYQDAEKILRANKKKNMNVYAFSKEYEVLVGKYFRDDVATRVIVSRGLNDEILEYLEADKDDAEYVNNGKEVIDRIMHEAIIIMAREQFNRFILSKFYKQWRSTESSHAIAQTPEDALGAASNLMTKGHLSERSVSVSAPRKDKPFVTNRPTRPEDLTVRAFANVDASEIAKVLGSESWLAALLAAVEAVPLAFSLATARKDRRGFPLMYCNKYFEKMTGYKRSEIIGKNCKNFLQCPDSERSSITTFSDALRNAIPAKTIITNITADKRVFKNLVAIKPVFTEQKKYSYVMAIHMDVSREVDDCVSKLQLAQELMDMLPSVIISDDDKS
jgi:PAS domain S-box-containing protein